MQFSLIIILLLSLNQNVWQTICRSVLGGLDYSDAFLACAKFRAAGKSEKLGTVRCENLVKNLVNFTKKREIYISEKSKSLQKC